MPPSNDNVTKTEIVSGASGVGTMFGVLALVAAILSFIIPLVGPLFITLFAILFGILAIRGGARVLGIITTAIVLINLVISPSFWLNLAASLENGPSRLIALLDILGIVALLYYIAKKRS